MGGPSNALADLERQQAQLRDTMLRISGAVQVLEGRFRHRAR